MIRQAIVAGAAAALLAGCAATVTHGSDAVVRVPSASASMLVLQITGSKDAVAADDWNAFKDEWKTGFEAQAAQAHVGFRMQDDGAPALPGEQGTRLTVFVNDYRLIRPGVHYLASVFGSNAFIDASCRYDDLKTGDSFAVITLNTASTSWQGLASATTDKQVQAIAADVMQTLQASAGAPAITAPPANPR